ncbi:hypothetical protein BT63DRAFT_463423 [Microthyrium microscopicum]|uniref:Uncharacterized protein n=1 Tax=Microthyrium microscopicum TaxID=703497 RepID=A0A6A6U4V1_9PEZI|nr:hypothetical protein BT63DRAFT_463423 [Microthyrium microscopicum]
MLIWEQGFFQEIASWFEFLNSPRASYASGVSRIEALFRTLILDFDKTSDRRLSKIGSDYLRFASSFLAFAFIQGTVREKLTETNHRTLTKRIFSLDDQYDNENIDSLLLDVLGKPDGEFVDPWSQIEQVTNGIQLHYEYSERFFTANANRSFFWTDDEYFGLGPIGIRSGDIACAIVDDGGLYIVRKHEGYHELVGPCFILGFMDGEIFEAVDNHGFMPIGFVIK